MFQLHTAYSLELLVLATGFALIYFGSKQASALLKMGGYVLTVLTTLNMLCTLYYAVRYWEGGYFKTPYGQSCPMMSGQGGMGMMQNGMMNGDMMKMMKMMEDMKDQGKMPKDIPNNGVSDEDHKVHHPDGQ
jgi:hypothetical protein